MSFLLKATSVALGYGGVPLIEGIDLEIRPGEFWVLIGPNGQGKTTLLRAVLGEIRPLAGRLELNPDFVSRERIGFVPQRLFLSPTLPTTVREFVSLGFVGLSLGANERRERLSWALDKVDLSGRETKDFWTLSGGQRQRALVARALIRRPEFLIADEPTAGLDVPGNEALARCLGDLHREDGLTILMVTHDLGTALRCGTHFALCGRGRIVAGAAESVLTPGNLERLFGVAVTLPLPLGSPESLPVESPRKET